MGNAEGPSFELGVEDGAWSSFGDDAGAIGRV